MAGMPVTHKDIVAYQRKVNALKNKASSLSDTTRNKVIGIVEQHRLKIKDIMTDFHGEDKQLLAKAGLKMSDEIQKEINRMIDETTEVLKESSKNAYDLAKREASALYSASGFGDGLFTATPELLVFSQGMSIDLVKSIGSKLLSDVNATISRAVVGGLSPFDAMKAVDEIIGKDGLTGVSFQAERIVRTETTRIYNEVVDQSLQDLIPMLENPEKLKKVWISGPYRPGRRENHQEINGQEVPVDQPFRIPTDDGIVELDYPQALGPETDPKKLAKETIMCGCSWEIVPESIMEAL
jgi:DNA-directed RNA polymerase subunit F